MGNPFKKLVGLKGVDEMAVSWVNDLPGLSVELVDALTTESDDEADAPAAEVWGRIHAAAFDRLESEIVGVLSCDSTFNPYLGRTLTPEALDGVLESEDGESYFGAYLSVPASPNSRVRLLNLIFMCNNTENLTTQLVVWDHRRHVYLKQQSVTIVPGVNSLAIEISCPIAVLQTPLVFVGIDPANIGLIKLSMPQWDNCATGYSIRPAYLFGGIVSTSSEIENYFYLEAEHQRTITSVIPRFADQLRLAYLYLCGSLLMTEKLASVNFNLFTNTNREFTIEQEEKLMKDFKAAVKPVARLIKQHLESTGNLQKKDDTESGYEMGSFV